MCWVGEFGEYDAEEIKIDNRREESTAQHLSCWEVV